LDGAAVGAYLQVATDRDYKRRAAVLATPRPEVPAAVGEVLSLLPGRDVEEGVRESVMRVFVDFDPLKATFWRCRLRTARAVLIIAMIVTLIAMMMIANYAD
jgi:hypothetical protein